MYVKIALLEIIRQISPDNVVLDPVSWPVKYIDIPEYSRKAKIKSTYNSPDVKDVENSIAEEDEDDSEIEEEDIYDNTFDIE